MKFIIVLFVCGFTFVQADNKSKGKEIVKECLKESGLKLEELPDANSDELQSKFKCIYKCALEKIGALENDTLVEAKLKPECKSVTGTDTCDLSYNYAKCVHALKKGQV